MEDQWGMPDHHRSQPDTHSPLKAHETDEVNEANERREEASRESGRKYRDE